MNRLTQREAARAWSIPWSTFRRKVKAGEVSIDAEKRVDASEMVRVFGEPRTSTNEPVGTSLDQQMAQPWQAEKARLEAENAGLRAVLSAKDETIRTQADALLRLSGPKADPIPPSKADPLTRRILIALAVFTAGVIVAVAFDLPGRL